MAMEYKTVNVPNELEAKTISELGRFGWTLKSSQRVFNQDSHNEYDRYGDYVYVETVTNTVDFTKLVFERDNDHPNYAQIARIENYAFDLSDKRDAAFYRSQQLDKQIYKIKSRMLIHTFTKKGNIICALFIIIPILIFLTTVAVFSNIPADNDSSGLMITFCIGFVLGVVPPPIAIYTWFSGWLTYANGGEGEYRDAFEEKWKKKINNDYTLAALIKENDELEELYSNLTHELADLLNRGEYLCNNY